MPEIIHFKVTQTREVEVAANTFEDAVRIAEAAFEHGQNSSAGVANEKGPLGVWGNTTSRIKELSIECERNSL